MAKITALLPAIALALTGCYVEGSSTAAASSDKARFATMRQCADEAKSTARRGHAKLETYLCERKVLGFASEQQEYFRGDPIVCAEPISDGA